MVCKKCNKQVADNISFCPFCGSYLNAVQNGFSTFENHLTPEQMNIINGGNSNNKFINSGNSIGLENAKKEEKRLAIKLEKQSKSKGLGILWVFAILLWIGAIYLIIASTKGEYIFADDPDSVIEERYGNVDYSGVSKSGQNNVTSTSETTAIVYDNQYLKQTVFNTIDDVYNLIDYDSDIQKKNCPAYSKINEDKIIANYRIRAVNFCEIDQDFASELVDVARFYYNKYPSARGYMTNLTIANVEQGVTYMAAFMPLFAVGTSNTTSGYPIAYKTQIILNAKYFVNAAKIENSVANGERTGYFPRGATRSSAVAHEFGHYISYVAMLNYYNTEGFTLTKQSQSERLYKVYNDFNAGDFSYKVIQEAYNNYHGSKTFDEFRQSISLYAVAKSKSGSYIYDETIAEAFHDYYLNGDNAAEASLLIIKALENYL